MLTTRGWATLGTAAALLVLWGLFGETELMAIGLFLLVAVIAAGLFVLNSRIRVGVFRRLAPVVVHEGDQAMVEVTLVNKGRRQLRSIVVEDRVERLGNARFAAARLIPGAELNARYQIICRPRGIYDIGPLRINVGDPFGIAESGATVGEADRLVVYPAVEDLEGFPIVQGHDPSTQTAQPEIHYGDEDFYTLREYQRGDDLRRVHWRSSAKLDELMIRQLETPWQSRAVVVFDERSSAYRSAAAFEKAVQGAASVIRHMHRSGYAVELWTSSTIDAPAYDRYTTAMQALATVRPLPVIDIRAAALKLRRGQGGGALIMVGGQPDADYLGAFLLLTRNFGRTLLLAVDDDGADLSPFHHAGVITLAIRSDEGWAPGWERASIPTRRSVWSTA